MVEDGAVDLPEAGVAVTQCRTASRVVPAAAVPGNGGVLTKPGVDAGTETCDPALGFAKESSPDNSGRPRGVERPVAGTARRRVLL